MKRIVWIAAVLVGAGHLSVPAWAASCVFSPVTGLAFSPDYSTAFVTFDDFTALVGDNASCGLSIDLTDGGGNTIPTGTVIAYSADYRGSLDPTSTASLSVTNSGLTTGATVAAGTGDPAPPGNVSFSNIVGTNGTTLDSDIELAMITYDDPFNAFSLETIDYLELGRTTIADIQTSVDQFSADHTALITHLNATADLLTGAGHPLEEEDGVSVFGGLGSFTAGATGKRSFGEGLTLQGGAAVFNQSAGGAAAAGLLFSGSLRYLAPDDAFVRPYGEVGLITAPAMAVSFTRSYLTSKGTTTATGSTMGALYGGFVKGGALLTLDENNHIVLSATLAKDWLITGAYSEALDGSNLFAATAPAQSGGFDTIKVGVDWTTKVAPRTDLTLSGALGRTIAEAPVAADVAFAGAFTGAPVSETFAEYGARVGYEIDPSQSVGALVHVSTGAVSQTHLQVGGDYHVRF